MKKRLFSAITAAAMTASAGLVYFPAGVFELTAKAADPITGETADGFTYEITEEAVTITGWTGDKETVTFLDVPDTIEGRTVTRLGQSSLNNMPLLTSIDLPSGLESMGVWALSSNTSLKEITLPKTLKKDGISCGSYYGIGGRNSFSDTPLETIILEDGIEAVPDYLCVYQDKLTKVVVPDSVTTVGYRAFGDADALTDIDLPSSVKTIEWCAFYGSDAFTTIDLPEGLETIERNAFEDCDSLAEIKFPSTLKTIGNEAFYKCVSLEKVELNEGLDHMGGKLFRDCEKLKEITVPSTLTEVWSPFEKSYVETVTIADGMEKIPSSLCAGSVVTTLNIPDSVTDLGNNLFNYDMAIKEFTLPAQITAGSNVISYSGVETLSFEGDRTEIPESMFQNAEALKTINWPANLTTIGGYAFSNCTGIETIHIPDTVKKIGGQAFQYCKSLTDLHIPENGCELGNYVFYHDDALKEVTVPAGLTFNNGEYTFHACEALETVTFAEGNTLIPSRFFYSCPSLREVNLPDGLDEIQYRAFWDCPSLRSINIPDSVTKINGDAFYWCTGLEAVHLPANLEFLGRTAFGKDFALSSITIPKSIKSTDGNCFYGSGLTEIWFEDGIEVIPADICGDSPNLKIAHIPGSVKEIGGSAFYKCHKLEELDMPFEPGELVPNVNYYYYTFRDCEALNDSRVNVADRSNSFINRVETSVGENGLINYTVYYKLNPTFDDLFEKGRIYVSTNSGNPIAKRSFTSDDTEGVEYSHYFTLDPNETEGIFRFSTVPEPGADISVNAEFCVTYNNHYREFADPILVDNYAVAQGAVTMKAPQKAVLRDGISLINVVGYVHGSDDVTIFADGVEVAALTANKYSGKFKGTIEIQAEEGQQIVLYAQSGDNKSELRTVECTENTVNIEKVLLTHYTHDLVVDDLTDVFTVGASPHITLNPSHPLNFEVTLSHNDLLAVYVSSTVNGQESDIPLTFDEESGTWKGEGFFNTMVPGTLNINVIPETSSTMVENRGGTAYINGHKFLETEDDQKAPDISDDLLALSKTTVEGDEDTVIAAFDVSETMDESAGFVHAETREKTLVMGGTEVTPEDVMADPESFGFVMSPMTYKDGKGEIHHYLVKIITDGDEMMGILGNIPLPEEQGASGGNKTEVKEDPYKDVKDGSLGNRVLNWIADWGKSSDTVSKCTSGSICIDLPASWAVGPRDDAAYDFVVNATTETEKGLLDQLMKAKDAKLSKELGLKVTKYSKGLDRVNNTLTYLEVANQGAGMVGEIRDIINSKDPRVQKHENELLAVSVGTTMSKATLTIVGGSLVAEAFAAGAIAIAGGAAILPELLAVGAVVATVWAAGKVIDGVSSWLKGLIIGDAKVGNDGDMSYLIDPSGIAYEFLPSNPIKGATAEIYYKDEDGNEVLWNAVDYEQLNPQITDSAGWFAWDVPEGMWKIKLTAEGYESTESEWLPVLPVQVNIDLNMKSVSPAEIKSAEYNSTRATVTFTRHMQDETLTGDSLFLTGADGTVIPAKVKAVKEEGNSTGCSITYTLTPIETTDLAGASVNITADALSYAGTASGSAVKLLTQGEESGPDPEDGDLGDVNYDGYIDASDASVVLAEYAATQTGAAPTLDKAIADVNFDDFVDASDASTILQYYAYTQTGGTSSMREFLASV